MNHEHLSNRRRLATENEANNACIERAYKYLAHTGLSVPELANRVGYGKSSLSFFLAGTYDKVAGTTAILRKKLNDFMDTHTALPSFEIPGELYETENVQTIQETFEKLLPKPVAYMIYAPPGSQKSFVLEHMVARLNATEISKPAGRRAFYIYSRIGIRPLDLIRRVCIASGCRSALSIDSMLTNLRFSFRNHRVVLVVDEAQHLSIECFEILRELLDRPPYFSLLFAGSHDLKKKFDEFSATLEQWNSRIISNVRLPGLAKKEAAGIIEREIGELLKIAGPQKSGTIIKQLIECATVRDAYEGGRTYINVRTLTNALDQMRISMQKSIEVNSILEQE